MLKKTARAIALMLFVAGSLSSLRAQNATTLEFSVPFDFMAANKIFRAGDYEVVETRPGVTRLRTRDGNDVVFFITMNVHKLPRQAGSGAIVFNRYGDRYFLSQMWKPNNATGRQAVQSAAEREQIAHFAKPESVSIASRTARK